MQLLKTLYNYRLRGATKVQKNDTFTAESGSTTTFDSGSTLNVAGTLQVGGTAVSSSAAELNYLDITTLGTGAASKAVVLDAGEDYTWPATGILTYGVLKDPAGTTLGATVAEINKACDVSARLVNTTATSLVVSAATHGGRIVTVNSAAPIAITLPAATGTGEIYTFVIGTNATGTAHTIKVANTTDIMAGVSVIAQTDTAQVGGFLTTATDDTISLNGTTQGGLKGDRITIRDIASGVFQVEICGGATGTIVTPFSATVN